MKDVITFRATLFFNMSFVMLLLRRNVRSCNKIFNYNVIKILMGPSNSLKILQLIPSDTLKDKT